MVTAVMTQMAHSQSYETRVLRDLALQVHPLKPWSTSYRASVNFTQWHERVEPSVLKDRQKTRVSEIQNDAGVQHIDGKTRITFILETTCADLCNSVYLEVKVPPMVSVKGVPGQNTGGVYGAWVWALGFAMIDECSFQKQDTALETLTGDYLEMMSELHSKPGTSLRDMIFKLDNVTQPDLVDLSRAGFTMHVPIRFFFTHGNNALPLQKMNSCNSSRVVIQFKLRALTDCFAYSTNDPAYATLSDNPTLGMVRQAAVDAVLPIHIPSWNDFDFALLLGCVGLDKPERDHIINADYHAIVNTCEACGPTMFENSVLNLRINTPHAVTQLVWAIADTQRMSLKIDIPRSTQGVRSFGGLNVEVGGKLNDLTDRRAGASELDTVFRSSTVSQNSRNISSSDAVREHRSDGLNGCLHLPRNRFDYRAVDQNGSEVEPLHDVQLELNGQQKMNDGVPGSYYRTVQQSTHCQKVGRKGIYSYAFGLDCTPGALNHGSLNFRNIEDVVLKMQTNAAVESELLLFVEHVRIFSLTRSFQGMHQ